MQAKDWIALAALSVSLISLALTLYERIRSEHSSIVKALQGDKENIAFTALKVSNKQWPSSPFAERYTDDVIAALCLAWIMEGSDRARALVLSALKELSANASNQHKISEILEGIENQFVGYMTSAYSDNPAEGEEKMERGLRKAQQLRTALKI